LQNIKTNLNFKTIPNRTKLKQHSFLAINIVTVPPLHYLRPRTPKGKQSAATTHPIIKPNETKQLHHETTQKNHVCGTEIHVRGTEIHVRSTEIHVCGTI
jgi:hypothetical protein